MIANAFLSWWHSMSGQPGASRSKLSSCQKLEDVLRTERMRVDRSGGVFSLVRFSLEVHHTEQALLQQFEHALAARLRATDVAGLLPDGRIGIILTGTTARGAWVVADSVRKLLPEGSGPVEFEVYEYPSHDHHPPAKGETVADSFEPVEPKADDDDAPLAESESAEEAMAVSADARPVQSAEVLFLQPLPGWKRALDVLGASVGLILLAPLFAVVAVVIKLAMPGPVFFFQQRAGLGGRPFWICKFRTMVVDAEAKQKELLAQNEQDGPAFKIKNDPRVTPLGRFLRKTSIDELPQLWNVLQGDMTLVGPRPLPLHEAAGCSSWQRRRMEVTPGLTCIWQIEGRSRVSFDEWVRMDLRYVSTRSLTTDLDLIARTVPAVLMKKGAC